MRILYRPGVRYHGVWMGNGGQVFQCFDPPWWHVWQWATWLWCTRVRKWPRGTVSIDNRGTSRTVQDVAVARRAPTQGRRPVQAERVTGIDE